MCAMPLSVAIWVISISLFGCAGLFAQERQLPPSVDLRPEFAKYGLVAKTQGNRDTCSLFAITGLVEFELAKHHPEHVSQLSQEYLIWASNQASGDKDEQAMFYHATQGLQMVGICSEALMPYKTKWDPARRLTEAAIAEGKPRDQWTVEWIKRWDVKSGLSDGQIHAVKQQLATKHPVAVGLRWPKKEQLNADYVLNVPPPTGVFDGHSILFVGYRDDAKEPGGGVFLFRNSNGPRWEMQGYAYMPYAYVRAYANDAVALHATLPEVAQRPMLHLECEGLRVIEALRCNASPQKMTNWGTRLWSGSTQLYCQAQKGSVLELELTIPHDGEYHIELLATCAPDYGQVRAALDGKPIGPLLDLYGGRIFPSGPMELGNHVLKAGRHHLRFTAVSKNEHSTGYSFGLDAIELRSVK
jgi:Papain family cysteine protease